MVCRLPTGTLFVPSLDIIMKILVDLNKCLHKPPFVHTHCSGQVILKRRSVPCGFNIIGDYDFCWDYEAVADSRALIYNF